VSIHTLKKVVRCFPVFRAKKIREKYSERFSVNTHLFKALKRFSKILQLGCSRDISMAILLAPSYILNDNKQEKFKLGISRCEPLKHFFE
jgi:hypothetical protein